MAGTGASGGRNARSTQDHILSGTFNTTKHSGHETPEPPKGDPVPPRALSAVAQEEWDGMVASLRLSRTLSPVDAHALYQYVCLVAEAEALTVKQELAEAAVDMLRDSQGDIEKADLLPFFQELGKMAKLAASYDGKITSKRSTMRQYLVEFGLTPAARSRVKIPTEKPKSKLEQFRSA